MNSTVLEVQGLAKKFGDRTAVNEISFHVDAGETFGLLGPNGSGKTTTMSMIAGILGADSGSIRVGGQPVGPTQHGAKGQIGLVPQDIALYEDLTTRENLDFFGRLQNMDGARRKARIEQVLEIVGLRDRADDRVDEYSGGMKRRANIAVGLLHEPSLLILDEPTVGVDPQSRNQILDSVEHLGQSGLSVIYTTHYMEEAERLCDRVGILDHGSLLAVGSQRELVSRVGQEDRIVVSGVFTDQTEIAVGEVMTLDGVRSVDVTSVGLELNVSDASAILVAALAALSPHGEVQGVEIREPNLEAVFLSLTGRALRD